MVRLTYALYVAERVFCVHDPDTVEAPPIEGTGVAEGDNTIRVLLADEQSLFRQAVKVVLSSEDDLVVVGEAADGLQAIAEVERMRPDVALLDADLPNCDGIRATRQISLQVPDCRVIVFSAQEDEQILVQALEAGASGYLSKSSPLVDLIDATRAVHRGDALVPPRMLGALLQRLIHRRTGARRGAQAHGPADATRA